MTNKLTREMIAELNTIAQEDWDKAVAMLDGINMVLGTQYGWLSRRVVFFDDNSSIAAKYASAHDAWAWAE